MQIEQLASAVEGFIETMEANICPELNDELLSIRSQTRPSLLEILLGSDLKVEALKEIFLIYRRIVQGDLKPEEAITLSISTEIPSFDQYKQTQMAAFLKLTRTAFDGLKVLPIVLKKIAQHIELPKRGGTNK
jgi:hypothetical protein